MAKPSTTDAVPAPCEAVPYLGQHRRGVDHGRIILPPEWRPEGAPKDLMLLLWPVQEPEYLLALPPSRFGLIQRCVGESPLADEDKGTIERLLSAGTYQRSIDGYGRLLLPDEVLQALGLQEEAVLVGRREMFEVWVPDRLKVMLAKPDAQRIANTLKSLKI